MMSGISPGARETDHPNTTRKIIEKLPYNLQDQWRRLVDYIHELEHRRAKFEDIVDIVERGQDSDEPDVWSPAQRQQDQRV